MKLPPLPTLRAFEAAARRESFLQAATELGMTAAAVSQHVKALEDWLGLALFERRPRGVRLTGDGRELGAACSEGLGHIARAVERLTIRRSGLRVSLACKPSVVNHWLGPRLPRFRAAHPEIQVTVVYPLGALTPEEAGADLLIRHGTRPPGRAEHILDAATRPTCSPSYLERYGPITTPADLMKQHLTRPRPPGSLGWPNAASKGRHPPGHSMPISICWSARSCQALASASARRP